MKSNKPFKSVLANRPGYSVFDLSYMKTFTCDMGQLIPVMCDEVVPGDIFTVGNQSVIRFQPLVAPILHEVNAYVHYFFVPYRLIWEQWEDFITGGVSGTDASALPLWNGDAATHNVGTLWDYMGLPTGVVPSPTSRAIAFPKRAYNLVWNEFYRDETLQPEVDMAANNNLLIRNWEKDYFTSALPWQQRGTAPALPISGTVPASISSDMPLYYQPHAASGNGLQLSGNSDAPYQPWNAGTRNILNAGVVQKAWFDSHASVNLSPAVTFNVADLRLAFQIQKWMERNARSGVRYTEFLHSHFGVAPKDERLQRPEYIGGSKSPIIVSEVLQTGSTDAVSPQGNMAGHGISASSTYCGKYRATEYGVILGLLSVMPRTMYQQGVDRQWLRRTRYDFYFPEFANLSEQAVLNCEIYENGVEAENKEIFGYQGRFDEMRTKRNMVCGQMRNTFDYWHLGRIFSSRPALNSSFIQCVPDKRIFAAPSEPGLIIQFANLIKAWRPIPIQSNPGLIDHN